MAKSAWNTEFLVQKLGVSKFQRQVAVACWSPARAASWAVPPRRSIYPPHKLLSCAVLPSFGSPLFFLSWFTCHRPKVFIHQCLTYPVRYCCKQTFRVQAWWPLNSSWRILTVLIYDSIQLPRGDSGQGSLKSIKKKLKTSAIVEPLLK